LVIGQYLAILKSDIKLYMKKSGFGKICGQLADTFAAVLREWLGFSCHAEGHLSHWESNPQPLGYQTL